VSLLALLVSLIIQGSINKIAMDHLVEIDNLTFRRADRVIYDGITLSIPKGKITAVMGPSGIGKTTLLRLKVIYSLMVILLSP
jgi:ABC-type transporter Mla maintaining outer membrane lipid asymmetry ATPase subunit MlaF